MPCLDFSQTDELMRPLPMLRWLDCSFWLKLSGDPLLGSSFHELKIRLCHPPPFKEEKSQNQMMLNTPSSFL